MLWMMWEGRRRGLQQVVFAQARWEFDLGSSRFKSTVSQCWMISGPGCQVIERVKKKGK